MSGPTGGREVVMTCSGDISDPAFHPQLNRILDNLKTILSKDSDCLLRVRRVEPWNSVRVTFTLGAEAAERLRSLALGGDPTLARLGILSVQLQPDQVISLRLRADHPPPLQVEQQEREEDGLGAAAPRPGGPAPPVAQQPVQAPVPQAGGALPQPPPPPLFRSPNVVAPPPEAPPPPPPPIKSQLFPFHSMTHAASTIHNNVVGGPRLHPPTQPSSNPLLVNLLQTSQLPSPVGSRVKSEEGSAFVEVNPGRFGGTPQGVQPIVQPHNSAPPPAYRARVPPPAYPGPVLAKPQVTSPQAVAAPPPPPQEELPTVVKDEPQAQVQPQAVGKRRQLLINPLTGVLEPTSTDSSDASDEEPNSTADDFNPFPSPTNRNSVFSDEEDDKEVSTSICRRADTTSGDQATSSNEKIKLRLKLDKTEQPVTPGYKVDIVEPRVPPLHISLRGRNAAVVRKEKKRDNKNRIKVKKEELEPGEIRLKSGKVKVGSEGDICVVPYSLPSVRNFPTEAEVASILRSVAPVNLLQEKQRTVDPVKKKVYTSSAALVTSRNNSTEEKRTKKCSTTGSSLLKSVVKTAAKEARIMSARITPAPNKVHRRDDGKDQGCSVVSKVGRNSIEDRKELVVSGGLPVTEIDVSETKLKARLLEETQDKNKGGEDSGIESMDALSEKSPNQGESPTRTSAVCAVSNPSSVPNSTQGVVGGGVVGVKQPPSPVPVRLTPALYTYSNPERHASRESPSPPLHSPQPHQPTAKRKHEQIDGPGNTEVFTRNGSITSGKSLLEQLLIDIPSESDTSRRNQTQPISRNTRSHHNTRLCLRSPDSQRVSPPAKRQRKPSESSNNSTHEEPNSRVSRRKFSSDGLSAENKLELQAPLSQAVETAKTVVPLSPANSTASSTSSNSKNRRGVGSALGESESSEDESNCVSPKPQRNSQTRSSKDEDLHRNLVSSRSNSSGGGVISKTTPARRQVAREKVRTPLETPTRRKTRSLALSGEDGIGKRRRTAPVNSSEGK